MKNFVQAGANVTITAAADLTAGDGVLTGALFGVAQETVLSGADVTLVRQGVFTLPKLSAQAWTVGQKMYWDTTEAECTTVASGNTLIGCAAAVAANPSDTGDVLLDGAVR